MTVSDHLKGLLDRFQVSFDACFVDVYLKEQRQPGKYFFQQPVQQSGRLAFLAFLPTLRAPVS